MVRPFLDVATESRLLDEVAQRRQRLSTRLGTVTPQTAQLAGSYADAYPWADPGVLQSFVQAGLSPDLPQVQQVMSLAAQQAAENGEFDTPADDVPDAWYERLIDVTLGWAKPAIRTGFTILAAPIEEVDALISSAGEAFFDETTPASNDDDLLGRLTNQPRIWLEALGELGDPGGLVQEFWENYTTKAARSAGLLALGDLIQGKHVDLGEGFLPGGAIYEERERAKYRLTLDGHFMTPGRITARQMYEPGSTMYQFHSGAVDFIKQIVLDPTNVALTKISKARQAVDTFQATGLIDGLRKTYDPARAVNHYLTRPEGRRMVRWLTESNSIDDIWQATGKANLDLARRLAATTDEASTFNILENALGTIIREKPTAGFTSRLIGGGFGTNEYGSLFGAGARVRTADNSRLGVLGRLGRLGNDMPARSISTHDVDDAARQLDLWMRNAHTPKDLRDIRIAELANIEDPTDVFTVTERIMDNVRDLLKTEWGLSDSEARSLTRLHDDLGDMLTAYDIDDLGRHVDVLAPLRPNIEGQLVEAAPSPGMISELVNDIIPLPDPRDIRRATPVVKQAQRAFQSGLWTGSVDLIETVMSTVWKPLQLLRAAYMVRVIGEEQIRMAASGYDSLFRHPIDAIAWTLSIDPKSRLAQKLAKASKKLVDPKGTTGLLGETWDDIVEHASSLSRGSAGWRGTPGEVVTGRFIKARLFDDNGDPIRRGFDGWVTELAHEANDPIMRRVAGGLKEGDLRSIGRTSTGSTFDDVAEWWWSGTGQRFRRQLGRMEGRSKLLTDRAAADAYLQQNYFDRLHRFTGGNPDLVELVATGRLDDINLHNFGSERKLSRLLEEKYSKAAPAFVKTPETITSSTPGARTLARLDAGIERGFNALMAQPTNFLSRSPTFRQKYYQRAEELISFADRPTQEAILHAAREANIGDDALARMASRMLKGEGTTLTSLDDVDLLAKGFALDETKKLLYDLQKRSQFFDMMRIVFPFGEAWKEIIGAWTGIIRQNPQTLRRFQQAVEGARAPSLFGEAETSPGSGEGFFHNDPQTGEEVFTYPAGWVGSLLGVNQDDAGLNLTGRVAGLNIVAATVLPGFGPAVQIPVSKLTPHTPKWDDLRDFVLPFGEQDSIKEAFIPAWMEKVFRAMDDPQKDRLFGNTVIDVQRALARTGDYNIRTVEGQQELYDDAVAKARILYAIRGIAQSVLPTGPSFSWTTADLEGNVVPVKLLADDLRRLTNDEYGGDRIAAFQEWVRRYGVDNVLAVVGKSTSIIERPVTEKGDEWLRAHQDLERDFEATIGYFAPEPAVGEFDYNAYLRQFETGAREALTPAEQLAMANDFLGRVQWEQAKKIAALQPGPVMSSWLAQTREKIAEDYAGFDGWVAQRTLKQRPAVDQQISELRRAVDNPELARTDAGQGIRIYLSALAQAEQMVVMLPGNVRRYQQAKAAAPIRAWLRSVAQQIIDEHPDFARVWFGVFEKELAEDEGF